ncbi:MAG: hypothetical protein CBD95_004400 [Flavobacteriales bacterium TMED235]|nr:MAG: hypothetical protein CBD95_004400 [Flavobacteriales bacterium TMED235]|tara:strand:- start:362 stop:583 length:222 start_codon:yes stop_codon:yes gene_type:complete
MIKFYFIGLTVLSVAILANIIAAKLSLKTWYDFLNSIGNSSLTLMDYLWLFGIYPLILGLIAKLGIIVWEKLF